MTLDGKPLPLGSVSLRPEGTGEAWDQPTGMVSETGEYVVYTTGREGAKPGKYRVIVFATEATTDDQGAAHPGMPRSIVPGRYNDPKKTPLRVEVSAHPAPGAYDLELTSQEQ